MNRQKLAKIAKQLVAAKKGILAADESTGTIQKRFDSINTPSTESTRQEYRELLFTTPGMEKFISGVILFDETLRQKAASGTPFITILKRKGVFAGIKVDKGAVDMAGFPGEKITEGLDGLQERLIEYHNLGAAFAKWRAVITIGKGIPSQTCIDSNAESLARYAALCQEQDLVPIVEPEVLMDGPHPLARCQKVTLQTLKSVFAHLASHKIYLPGMLLKPNMVISGKEAKTQASGSQIAKVTINTFKKVVPRSVPGVVFLSGGQTADQATENLNFLNQLKASWQLSYSYGRALQEDALKTWAGQTENIRSAQEAFFRRASLVSAARDGRLKNVL